jgi:U4/U6.U5 tri-snRNP-associated protein 1
MNGSSEKDDMDVEGDVDNDDDEGDDDDMEIEGDDDMDVDEVGVRGEDSAGDHDASESSSSHQQHSIQGIAGALQLFQRTGAINSKKSDVQLKGRTKDKRAGDLVVPVAEVGGGTKFQGGGTSGKLDTFVIEYKDDQGKKLTTKEAYRQLSYKFHGKMPSKNVLDKRLKKAKREEKLAKASANEAPDSLKLFQKAQQNSAFVVIG